MSVEPERHSMRVWIKIVRVKEEKNRGETIVGYSWHHYPGLSDRNCTDSRVCTLWLMERMSECDRTGDQPRDALSDDTFNSCPTRHSGKLPVTGAREIEPSMCILLRGFHYKSTPVTLHSFSIWKAWVSINLYGNVITWKRAAWTFFRISNFFVPLKKEIHQFWKAQGCINTIRKM